MLDGIKTRLNTNKRQAGSGRGGGGSDASISCLIHLKIKAKDVRTPVMAIKDDVAHNYGHAQSRQHTYTHTHKHTYSKYLPRYKARQDKASIKTLLQYKISFGPIALIYCRLYAYIMHNASILQKENKTPN